eukprot:352205-Chlamydomonas_euryale.AAC.4
MLPCMRSTVMRASPTDSSTEISGLFSSTLVTSRPMASMSANVMAVSTGRPLIARPSCSGRVGSDDSRGACPMPPMFCSTMVR